MQGAGLCKSKDKMAWCLVRCGCQTNQARQGLGAGVNIIRIILTSGGRAKLYGTSNRNHLTFYGIYLNCGISKPFRRWCYG